MRDSFPRDRFTESDMHQASDLTLTDVSADAKFGYIGILTHSSFNVFHDSDRLPGAHESTGVRISLNQ